MFANPVPAYGVLRGCVQAKRLAVQAADRDGLGAGVHGETLRNRTLALANLVTQQIPRVTLRIKIAGRIIPC